MPVLNSQMFFLGNFSDMDTFEFGGSTENPNAILGAYSKPPLIDVAVDDINGGGTVSDDEYGSGGEDFTYDAGAGSTSQFLDSTQTYMTEVLLADGSTSNIQVTVIQLQNGDVFLTDYANNGSLDNLAVQSIELLYVTGSNYTDFYADSSVDNTSVVCFTPGTLIETDLGPVPVEMLHTGHNVRTLDHGFQPIRWIGDRTLAPADLAENPNLRPVIIRKGALGNTRRMRVSPQHGFLIDGYLIRAKLLVEHWGGKVARIDQKSQSITYIHFMCDRHEIVFADSAPSESLYPGPLALRALERSSFIEMLTLFPELIKVLEWHGALESAYGRPARQYMTGGDIRRRKPFRLDSQGMMSPEILEASNFMKRQQSHERATA